MKHKYLKLLKYIIYISLIILAISTTLLVYWLYQPSNVLEFNQKPIPTRIDGGVVILHVNYCKNSQATGRVRTSFVSSSREIFLPVATDTQPSQCKDTDLPLLIPKDLPSDTYRVHFHVDYNINPLRHDIVDVDSTPFSVQ